jgi:hypothetical protein
MSELFKFLVCLNIFLILSKNSKTNIWEKYQYTKVYEGEKFIKGIQNNTINI